MDPIDRRSAFAAEFRREWRILLGCTIGLAFGASILLYINGAFVTAFQRDFGWTRSQISSASLINVLTVLPLAPIAGAMVDRWGVRWMAPIGMGSLAVGFLALSRMSGSFPVYVAISAVTANVSILSTGLCFTKLINERFHAARGLALGVAMIGTGLVGAVAPPLVAEIIASRGWRVAYVAMAILIGLAIPVTILLIGPPRASGDEPIVDSSTPAPSGDLRSVVLDPRFIRLAAIFFFMALGVTGFTFHLIPMLTDGGMPPVKAASIQGLLGVAMIAGRLGFSATADHIFAPRIAAFMMAVTVVGMIAFEAFGLGAAIPFSLGIGFSMGAETTLIGYLNARYFGLEGYAKRFALLFDAYLLANGLSPLLIALIAEHWGGYRVALWFCAAAGCVAIFLLATAPGFDRAPGRLGGVKRQESTADRPARRAPDGAP